MIIYFDLMGNFNFHHTLQWLKYPGSIRISREQAYGITAEGMPQNSGVKMLDYYLVMPRPSASSKFVLSVLKFLSILKFLRYTQNFLGILKWTNLCRKILLLSIPKWFWVYIKNWARLKKFEYTWTKFWGSRWTGQQLNNREIKKRWIFSSVQWSKN